jgi:hypothetical protein
MGWETRKGRGRYYTRTSRENGHFARTYLGTGPEAEQAAAEDDRRRAERRVRAEALRLEDERRASLLAPLEVFCRLVTLLTEAALVRQGFTRHGGEWRRRRVPHDGGGGEGLPGRAEGHP